MTELPACCCRYGSPSSTTLVYRCFSPATQHVPWWVHHKGHPRLFSRSAQSFTPGPLCESTLGQLGKSYKKKKRNTESGRSAPWQHWGRSNSPGLVWRDSHAGSACGRRLCGVSPMHGQMQPVWPPLCQFPTACHWGWGGHRFKVTMWLLFTDYSGIKVTGHRLDVSACGHRTSL